jgi:hypothetical protein
VPQLGDVIELQFKHCAEARRQWHSYIVKSVSGREYELEACSGSASKDMSVQLYLHKGANWRRTCSE